MSASVTRASNSSYGRGPPLRCAPATVCPASDERRLRHQVVVDEQHAMHLPVSPRAVTVRECRRPVARARRASSNNRSTLFGPSGGQTGTCRVVGVRDPAMVRPCGGCNRNAGGTEIDASEQHGASDSCQVAGFDFVRASTPGKPGPARCFEPTKTQRSSVDTNRLEHPFPELRHAVGRSSPAQPGINHSPRPPVRFGVRGIGVSPFPTVKADSSANRAATLSGPK